MDLIAVAQFEDFDAFCEACEGWDAEFRQLDRGGFRGLMTHVISDDLRVLDAYFSRRLLQIASPPSGYWTIGVPANPDTRFIWRGHQITGNHLVAFPRGSGMECVSLPGFHVHAVSISEEAMDRICTALELPRFEKIVGSKEAVLCPSSLMDRIRRQGARLIQAVGRDASLVRSPRFRFELQQEWPERIVRAFATSAGATRRLVFPRRQHALEKALSAIHERSHEPVSVRELEDVCGASGRTLRYAFEEEFALSPKRFLEVHRLNKVFHRLRRSAYGSTKISDVANSWGFWHMGNFARDYRRQFGELPSDTLARNRHE